MYTQHTLIIIISLIVFPLSGQDIKKPLNFAYVSIPRYNESAPTTGTNSVIIYNNGRIENIDTIINATGWNKDFLNDSIMAMYEFKMLQYLYSQGFEMIGTIRPIRGVKQFYFIRK